LYNELYKIIGLDKPEPELLLSISDTLEKSFKKTVWNIGVITESTARLKFTKEDELFKYANRKAQEIFQSETLHSEEKEAPEGYKRVYYIVVRSEGKRIGVALCLSAGKEKIEANLGDVLGFIIQQSRLKAKLVKDTMLMNTIIMSSQTTASSTEIDPLVKILIPQLKVYLAAEIRLTLKDEDKCYYYSSSGEKKEGKFPAEASIAGEAIKNKRPLMIQKAYKEKNFNPEFDSINEGNSLNLIAAPVLVSGEAAGVLVASDSNPERVFVGSELVWVRSVCGEIGATLERLSLYKGIKKLFYSSIESLAAAMEGKDPYTHGHSRRVTMFSMVIGRELGLSEEEMERVRLSALLHDIGKIAVPETILLKTTQLTDEEWHILRQHPERGVKMLEPVKEFAHLFEGIKHHHERFDGNGYPSGLKGKDIPRIARIISIADAFDAMTSQRSYRDAMSEKDALKEVEKCRGTQFDPELADIFLQVYREKFL